MNLQPIAAVTPSAAPAPRWRAVLAWTGRAVWAAFAAAALFVLLRGAWMWFDINRRPCSDPVHAGWAECPLWQQGLVEVGLSAQVFSAYTALLPVVAGLPLFGLSFFVMRRRPDRPTAVWAAMVMVALGAIGRLSEPVVFWAYWPEQPWLDSVIEFVHYVFVGPGVIVAFIYPDGRFVPRWTRWLTLAFVPLDALARLLPDSPFNLYAWPAPLGQVTQAAVPFSGLIALLYRYRRVADGPQRQQIRWFALGLSAIVLVWLVDFVAWDFYPALTGQYLIQTGLPLVVWVLALSTAWYASQAFLTLCLAFAIFRYRLWDIDVILNRALVYGTLTAAVFAIYLLVAGGLGALLHTPGSPALALVGVGIVALVVQPLRDGLQRAVNRLMYGERDEPYAVLTRLGQRLEGALAPDTVLPNVVETVAQALKLPYAAISLAGSEAAPELGTVATIVAAHGAPAGETVRLPLSYQGETLGSLIVSPRPGESLSTADRRLLEDLARQTGMAAHAVQLTADLQRSRAQLVTAREEERRRLRRDLHDGLGSQLAALHLRADTARALIASDRTAAEAVVVELRDELRAAVGDIRRVVYELRPPALDELGLAGALRALAAQHKAPGGLEVSLDVSEPLPPLPAAVEVAAYRIAQEALTNVTRHAKARTCTIRLGLGEAVQLEVTDDGQGLPLHYQAGVGLRSMRERSAELGGTVAIQNRPGGGAQVLVRLPLAQVGG